MFSPDPTEKVSKFFQKSEDARFFSSCPRKNVKKTPDLPSQGYGAADPQRRTPNVSADFFIGRWTLGVERRTLDFCFFL